MKQILLTLLMTLISVTSISAKVNITVQGTVYGSNKKDVIIGALVRDKNTNSTTTTDIDGQFIMTVEEGSPIEITALGYAPKTVKAKSPQMDIYLSKKTGIGLAVKPYGEFGVYNNLDYNSDLPTYSMSSSSFRFGVDLGYTFLDINNNTLEINAGVAYRKLSYKTNMPGISYNYEANPSQDMDGVSYIRYYNIDYMIQKSNIQYFSVPVYLTYAYHFSKRVNLHVDLGVNLNFQLQSKLTNVEGSAYSYGIYPGYGDLLIDSPWMNEFGKTDLANSRYIDPGTNDTKISLLTGLGVEIYVAGPFSIDIGARCNIGLTDTFYNPDYDIQYTPPVSYWVYGGQEVLDFSYYTRKSKFSNLSVRLGFNFRF